MLNQCPQCGKAVPKHSPNAMCPACLLALSDSIDTGSDAALMLQGQFQPGQVIDKRYRIVSLLGRGGMGEVYRADDLKLEQPVALKMLPPELAEDPKLLQALYNEVRQARRVSHPHVCRVHDVGEWERHVFLSMQFIEGEDLSALLQRIGRLPEDKAYQLAQHLCEGTAAAHQEGVLHLDLKPANLMIDKRGDLRITDFGLARLAGIATDDRRIAGTPPYMAPEQLLRGEASKQCDLYAIALIISEMFTGKRVIPGQSFEEIRQFHAEGRGVEVPSFLETLVADCLQADPDRRPESIAALLARLTEMPTAISRTFDGVPACAPKSEEALVPDVLDESDVVLAYANLDDHPVVSGHPGWVSQLHENLTVRVSQLSGKPVAVVKLPDNSTNKNDDQAVLDKVPQAKAVVSVFSPPFVQSDRCQRLVETFWTRTHETGNFEVDRYSRLLKVVKCPLEEAQIPDRLRDLYARLAPYEFYERDPVTGRLREFDEAFGSAALQRFHERVYDVAYDVSQVLRHLGDHLRESHQRRTANPKTIFLAATTSDVEPQRDQLRRELTELGHDVIPKQPLPLVASELTTVVQRCLEQADVAIHLVGEHFGFVPEATELSVVALQNEVAAEYCHRAPLRRLIWKRRGLQAEDQRQAAFLKRLETDATCVAGAELIADTLENLKMLLLSRWDREQPADEPAPKDSSTQAVKRLYLIADRQDEEALEPLEDYFYSRGVEVSLPGFDTDEAETQQIHIQNLSDCDAVLIYYGAASMHWVDFKIRDLQKASGYRDGQPIPVSAVYLAPPMNRRKERFKSVLVETIRQSSDAFLADALDPFVESLNGGGQERS